MMVEHPFVLELPTKVIRIELATEIYSSINHWDSSRQR